MGDIMNIINSSLGILSLICIFIILVLSSKTKKAFSSIILNSIFGITAFMILYITRKFTGIVIMLNPYTFFGSVIFGVPAVIGVLILNLIF